MNIGNLEIKGHTVLAPLAGITNIPFRRIVKKCGCSLVCSEMVSAKGLLYNSKKTQTLIETLAEERPVSVQIFGAEPSDMAKAASVIEESGNADIIDINFGCSVKKVVKTGAGAALMQNIRNAENIIRAVRESISIPLTIKIRTGWDSSGIQAFRIADLAQEIGVDAITFHPRTATQGFRGKADWSLIRELRKSISIPVIGNGDIYCADDGIRMMEETGCDAVMVGRGAMANPFILSEIESLISDADGNKSGLRSEQDVTTRSPDEIFAVMKELLENSADYFGELPACKMMRSRLVWFVKGWPGCSTFRHSLGCMESVSQAIQLIDEYRCYLSGTSASQTIFKEKETCR